MSKMGHILEFLNVSHRGKHCSSALQNKTFLHSLIKYRLHIKKKYFQVVWLLQQTILVIFVLYLEGKWYSNKFDIIHFNINKVLKTYIILTCFANKS